jgi:superfamily II DNA/RNA helicase/very-short-patch-repair endonuclease
MDVFHLRNQLISDYASYVQSFIHLRDPHISKKVYDSLTEGLLWPDPLIQLNPAFEPGAWIDEMVADGTLHPECSKIFRIKPEKSDEGNPLRLHRHQVDAIKAAKSDANYVLTTGTGSGKSLAYIVPIVDHVLRNGKGKGIQAIVVYPMNALCNSQYGELEKFLCNGYPKGKEPVKFAKYTGQESDDQKQEIIADPPDIILTNYVMLELILTRPEENKSLVKAAQGLRFLVLDELHTYRGRQGADIALLVRRVRNACKAEKLQCVGTSATMAGPGSYEDQKIEVARVAQKLFGAEVTSECVIGETLKRSTPEAGLSDPVFLQSLRGRVIDTNNHPPADHLSFTQDPLSIWIENTFGIAAEKESGRLIRSKPRTISGEDGAAKALSELINVAVERCEEAIKEGLLAGYHCKNPDTGFPCFAFRLHQFISRGGNVYASLDKSDSRYITVYGQQFVPGDRSRILLPLVFCRECGQEYYCVRSSNDGEENRRLFTGRELPEQLHDEESEAGFLYQNEANPWGDDAQTIIEKLPVDWLEEAGGMLRIRKERRPYLPQAVIIDTEGQESEQGETYYYSKSPFRFCLNCGVSYDMRQRSDLGKLASLGTEGRSSATTILSLSAIRNLKKEETLDLKARKLLSFTDNRQDASLQSGHFNDFIEIGLIRSALYRAVSDAGIDGISHDELTQKVFAALDLPKAFYAIDPDVRFLAEEETKKALRHVLGYRLYHDLRRGWRVMSPNLEQCGLLEIRYASLKELSKAEEEWGNCHPALVGATQETRYTVAKVLLDFMRRSLAIKVDYLDINFQERIQQQSNQRLKSPWAIDDKETMVSASIVYPRGKITGDFRGNIYLSPRSGYGQYLRRRETFPEFIQRLGTEDTAVIIKQLFQILRVAGLVEEVAPPERDDDAPGYQLPGAALLWVAGDGAKPFHDLIRMPTLSEAGGRTNRFFVEFYKDIAQEGKGLEAHEHTAQVDNETRQQREDAFKEGKLPILYCSPTMELGVDISTLNAVNMRNVPPTPANYAQRSGRAGRSGQPALVFTYCTTGSPHDQYFFKRPELMVAGSVTPPRLELANEDLIKAHIQAVWLAETGQSLGKSLKDVLDLAGENPTLALQTQVFDSLTDGKAKARALTRTNDILKTIGADLKDADWYSSGWLEEVFKQLMLNFEQACERWRGLYRSALKQREIQNRIIGDASRSASDKTEAKRLRREAEAQLELLIESQKVMQSDFYSYRYFASEGFLPGYNFPRLPLSAFIPGRRNKQDSFLSRPRFLAISEFGPRNIVYHEGSRYVINRVIMPVGDDDVKTATAKLCPQCGYLHDIWGDTAGADLCEFCDAQLEAPLRQLFRIQNVSTKRKDRINCDEEERQRQGYEIKTGVRFADHDGKPSYRKAAIEHPTEGSLAKLIYGNTATIWRINMGWKRSEQQTGFILDTERGYWGSNSAAIEQDEDDPMTARSIRVIPFVEDRRNCLLFEPTGKIDLNQMASLQSAFKNAIQTCYQLEDNELAVEPMPARDDRRVLLFYEASEGGAGVLRHLVDDPDAFANVAKAALELCHFDPVTGEDRKRAERSREDCEAACYDCLLSYSNQTDHRLIDRKSIKDMLLKFNKAQTSASPVGIPRAEHLKRLMNQAGSELEKKWLRFVDDSHYHLPSKAQCFIEKCQTRPDFLYEDHLAVIYVNGPIHDYPERAKRDEAQRNSLEDLGYTVIPFGHQDDWNEIIAQFPHIFGIEKKS